MNIEDKKARYVYRFEKDDKVSYSIKLCRKNQDGTFTNGFMPCKFSQNANVPDKSKIVLNSAWLDFWIDENKKTHLYLFINKYEIQEELKELPNVKTQYEDTKSDIKLSDKDIDDIFGKQEEQMELPF